MAVTGAVFPTPCGVNDYGDHLSAELRRLGIAAATRTLTVGDGRLVQSLEVARQHLRWARHVPPGCTVVWNYSAFAYGHRGVPLPGIVFGMLLRLRGIRVVTVLHEMASPWEGSGRRRVQALLQRLALPVVLAGSTVAVVTTEQRSRWLRPLSRLLGRPVRMLPVFSNIPVAETSTDEPGADEGNEVVVLGHQWLDAHGRVLLHAVHAIARRRSVKVTLLGAPGPESASGHAWRAAAKDIGVDHLVTSSGILGPAEYSRRLRRSAAVVAIGHDGPSSRHSTLAAALAHGCPIIAVDGPDRWDALEREGAARIVAANSPALALAIEEVLDDRALRDGLAARSAAFYARNLSLDRVGRAFADLVDPPPVRSP